MLRTIRFYLVLLLVLVVVGAVVVILSFRMCSSNSIGIVADDHKETSLTQLIELRQIGEWEFLSIEDEELMDTLRKGILSDDHLMRIYYGTLRLGFDLSDAPEGWLRVHDGEVHALLPPIRLLDENFIDEARTTSFFESGHWSDQARAEMLTNAYNKMLHRCLTHENIHAAEDNAQRQFYRILRSLGFENVTVLVTPYGEK